MFNSITLCFISFLGGGMIGMGTVLFVQGAFYNENKIEEKRNQSQINEIMTWIILTIWLKNQIYHENLTFECV